MPRCRYPSDRSDAERAVLRPLIPAPRAGVRLPNHDLHANVDAILSVRQGRFAWRKALVQRPDMGLHVVWMAPGQEPPVRPTGFQVLPRRWVVERTFTWLGRNHRLSKDDKAVLASEEAWISAAASRLLLRRLAR